MPDPDLVVSLPDERMRDSLAPLPAGVRTVVWDFTTPSPEPRWDLVVPPYMGGPRMFGALEGVPVGLIQSQAIGYDGIEKRLPAGLAYANAAGVHETSTAELALALTLASLRGVDEFARDQDAEHWYWKQRPSLADRTVLILGYGGIGRAAAARYAAFETRLIRVATTARDEPDGHVHGVDELPELLPQADVVLVAVRMSRETHHLVDDAFLTRMRDGALLVNVARGKAVDTDALLRHLHAGRLRAALDVTDPEPLPAGHPLWHAPGVLISPHQGGNSTAMLPRIDRLVRTQIERMRAGDAPLNVVLRT